MNNRPHVHNLGHFPRKVPLFCETSLLRSVIAKMDLWCPVLCEFQRRPRWKRRRCRNASMGFHSKGPWKTQNLYEPVKNGLVKTCEDEGNADRLSMTESFLELKPSVFGASSKFWPIPTLIPEYGKPHHKCWLYAICSFFRSKLYSLISMLGTGIHHWLVMFLAPFCHKQHQ
jgi:hypothetical protein